MPVSCKCWAGIQRKDCSESQEVSPWASADVESQLGSIPSVQTLPKVEEGLGILRSRSEKAPNDMHANKKNFLKWTLLFLLKQQQVSHLRGQVLFCGFVGHFVNKRKVAFYLHV